MVIVNGVVGHERDPEWAARLRDVDTDVLDLDQWQAQKNRLRTRTRSGFEIALALPRTEQLMDGDILYFDADTRRAVVARVALNEVMIIDLTLTLERAPETIATICLELGHALGNQHWPAVVRNSTVYVPLTVDKAVMASVMKTHAFSGIVYRFQPGAEVIPYLAPHEARRLFGGADATPHQHLHAVLAPASHTDAASDG